MAASNHQSGALFREPAPRLGGRIELLEIEPHRVVEGGSGPAIARRERRRLDFRAHLEPRLRDVEAEILLHVLAVYERRETHGRLIPQNGAER